MLPFKKLIKGFEFDIFDLVNSTFAKDHNLFKKGIFFSNSLFKLSKINFKL